MVEDYKTYIGDAVAEHLMQCDNEDPYDHASVHYYATLDQIKSYDVAGSNEFGVDWGVSINEMFKDYVVKNHAGVTIDVFKSDVKDEVLSQLTDHANTLYDNNDIESSESEGSGSDDDYVASE
jgi:hypothetical protein